MENTGILKRKKRMWLFFRRWYLVWVCGWGLGRWMTLLSWVVDYKTSAPRMWLGTIDVADVAMELESRGWSHSVKYLGGQTWSCR